MNSSEAIYYIRDKRWHFFFLLLISCLSYFKGIFFYYRKNSVQMNDQIKSIQDFENFIKPLRIIFADLNDINKHFTLSGFVYRQIYFLHGYEARKLKHIPKVIIILIKNSYRRFIVLKYINH